MATFRLPLSPEQSDWLKRLQKKYGPKRKKQSTEDKDEHLLYVLRLRDKSVPQAVTVELYYAFHSFSFGRSHHTVEAIALTDVLEDMAAFKQDDSDRACIELLKTSAHELSAGPLWFSGKNDWPLIKALLETGRCYWKSSKTSPLRLGQPRAGIPSWKADAEFCQWPTLEVNQDCDVLLPFSPPAYIEGSMLGPVQTPLPDQAAAWWVRQPPCPPEEVAKRTEEIFAHGNAYTLPLPAAYEVDPIRAVDPVPHLHLFAVRDPEAAAEADDDTIYGIEISFDYESASTGHENSSEVIHLEHEGQIKRWRRDLKQETYFLDRLGGYDLLKTRGSLARGEPSASTTYIFGGEGHWPAMDFVYDGLRDFEDCTVTFDPSFDIRPAVVEDWYGILEPETENNWFSLDLGIVVEGEKVNLLPILMQIFQETHERAGCLAIEEMPDDFEFVVRLENGVVTLPKERVRRFMSVLIELYDPSALGRRGKLSIPRTRAAQISVSEEFENFPWEGGREESALRELGQKLKSFGGLHEVDPPSGLQASLRPYQADGLAWLQFLREHELGGILADDMGLGKTIQALAHILIEKEQGRLTHPCLVIAPTSLMTNWAQEAARFTPALRVVILHGNDRHRHFETLSDYDLILTTYPLLVRDQETLLAIEYHLVILDEAQFAKNFKTKTSKMIRALRTQHRLCMTGTPMENHLGELWSLFDFLMPGFLGHHRQFGKLFRNPIEKDTNLERQEMLAKRIAPFLLRRTKEQVLDELPPKTEMVRMIEIGGSQRDLYESVRLSMHEKVRREIARRGVEQSQIIILEALLKLRQICCHPKLLPLKTACNVRSSAKFETLFELLPQMVEEGRRILLFSSFSSMLELIEAELDKIHIPYAKLTGKTKNRAAQIEAFQKGEVPLFLITLKAGGVGLNLTAADTVIHYDPWWNPAAENQATDRAHRIGQDKPVFVYKLITEETVEEKIQKLQTKKRELAGAILGHRAGEKFQITREDIENLLGPTEL